MLGADLKCMMHMQCVVWGVQQLVVLADPAKDVMEATARSDRLHLHGIAGQLYVYEWTAGSVIMGLTVLQLGFERTAARV
jgi:hypothetical protein